LGNLLLVFGHYSYQFDLNRPNNHRQNEYQSYLAGKNTLAYCDTQLVTVVKSFTVKSSEQNVLKKSVFLQTNYQYSVSWVILEK
jgi:hypothetical protein